MQQLLQEGAKTSCWPLIWTGSLETTTTKPSVGRLGCIVIYFLCLLQELFNTVLEAGYPVYLDILLYLKASCAISICKT